MFDTERITLHFVSKPLGAALRNAANFETRSINLSHRGNVSHFPEVDPLRENRFLGDSESVRLRFLDCNVRNAVLIKPNSEVKVICNGLR